MRRREANSPALCPPIPSETARTRCEGSRRISPDLGSGSVDLGFTVRVINESSLLRCPFPLMLDAAQLARRTLVLQALSSEGIGRISESSKSIRQNFPR